MTASRKGIFSTILVTAFGAMLIVLLSSNSGASAGDPPKGDQPVQKGEEPAKAEPAPKSPVRPGNGSMYIDPDRRAELERQGHSRTEIYTALALEEQTGVPVERWLEGRKQGKEFPELIQELAKGKVLERPKYADDARNLGEETIRALLDEGYSSADIMSAGDVLAQYGGDPREYLKRHLAGESWVAIREAEHKKWSAEQEKKAKELPQFWLGKDGLAEATESGLTKNEIKALMKQGFTLEEILGVDALAYKLGLDIREIAAAKRPDQSLRDALEEAAHRYVEAPAVNKCLLNTKAGLTTEEVDALVAAGESAAEIVAADSRAYLLGLDLKSVAAGKKNGEKLAAAVERAHRERTPAERAAMLKKPHPHEETRVKFFAEKTGRTEAEIRKLRAEGKSWIEIDGWKSPDGQPSVYEIADSFGITDHNFLERALELGFSFYDVRQANRIAQSVNLPIEDVLAVKTSENTWDDVIRALSPLPLQQ